MVGRFVSHAAGRRIALLLGAAHLLGCTPPSGSSANGPRSPDATQTHLSAPPALTDWPANPPIDPGDAPVHLRIVSAAPSVTEMCCALGLREQLVGRTRYCVHPPGIEQLPSIGALLDTNVESLLAAKPDLVILSGNSRLLAERLAPLSVRCISVPDSSVEDVLRAIRSIGEQCGRPRTAERVVAGIRTELAAVAQRSLVSGAPRVLILPDCLSTPPSPPHVAGPGSFYDDLLRLAGAQNAAPADSPPFAALSLEVILAIDPDVIIELDPEGVRRPNGQGDAVAAWRQLGPLTAVREGRIRVLKGGEHYVPGPRIAGTLEALSQAIADAQHSHANPGR